MSLVPSCPYFFSRFAFGGQFRNRSMLVDELRAPASAVIELAQGKGLGSEILQLPYTVRWMEPQTATSWTGREETRLAPSFRHLRRELGESLDADPRYQAFQAAAKEFDETRAKPLPAFW